MVTQQQLKQLLEYNPATGIFQWRDHPTRPDLIGRDAGRTAGAKGNQYRQVTIHGIRYSAHHLAWFYVHGEWTEGVIDHVNGDSLDNRLRNLEPKTQAENNRNAKRRKDNSTGITGVVWDRVNERWRSHIGVNGHLRWLGSYDNLLDAVAARKSAELKHGFHPNHGR